MVYFKVSRNAAFYEALGTMVTYLDPPTDGVKEMPFLAIYQTGKTIPRYMPEYQNNVRVKSELWDADKTCFQVAKFDSDHLELVEVLGSYEYIEGKQPGNHPVIILTYNHRSRTIHHSRQSHR